MMYHNSVFHKEAVEALNINPEGVYVDVTFGGGGHSRLICEKLNSGKLIALDQDKASSRNIIKHKGFKLIHANFRHIKRVLRFENILKIDGLLADLGVSSYQFDNSHRGFSIRSEGLLDMRMNDNAKLTAHEIVNEYSLEKLSDIFFNYGDLRNSKRIARTIINKRREKKINTTQDLVRIVSDLIPINKKNKFLAKLFQSIRIEVNDEICCLKELLSNSLELLNSKGRLVFISYHSLEDRLVKNLFKTGNIEGVLKRDIYGNTLKKIRRINKKVITPSDDEICKNSRSRSAKLRIAEKI